jgi:hypothetical protein
VDHHHLFLKFILGDRVMKYECLQVGSRIFLREMIRPENCVWVKHNLDFCSQLYFFSSKDFLKNCLMLPSYLTIER